MKFICKALLSLKELKNISKNKVIILCIIAFGTGHISPELLSLLTTEVV